MEIRKVKIEDFEQCINLYKQLYDAEKIFDNNLIDTYKLTEKEKQKIEKRIKSRKIVFLVAEENNKIVGLIDGYILDNDFFKKKLGYLDHLCVDTSFRNKGIATKLIEEFTNVMHDKNISYLNLNAFGNNKKAVNLYKKIGFEEYSIYYIKNIDI